MNLHAIVSGAIGSVNHHEMVTLYRCKDIQNTAGLVSVEYEKENIIAQVQAPDASDLKLFNNLADARHVRKFYINAPASTINRFKETAGDIFERPDGSFWLIDIVRDDFSPEGWLCCLATLQHEPPEGIKDKEDEDEQSEEVPEND